MHLEGKENGKAALADRASAAKNSGDAVSAEDVIRCVLRMGCGKNHQPAVIAKLLQVWPARPSRRAELMMPIPERQAQD